MDVLFLQMKQFQATLEEFNQNISTSWREVENAYEQLAPQWQGENRHQHDEIWMPLQEMMQNYFQRQSPVYTEFLIRKLQFLGRYLNDD